MRLAGCFGVRPGATSCFVLGLGNDRGRRPRCFAVTSAAAGLRFLGTVAAAACHHLTTPVRQRRPPGLHWRRGSAAAFRPAHVDEEGRRAVMPYCFANSGFSSMSMISTSTPAAANLGQGGFCPLAGAAPGRGEGEHHGSLAQAGLVAAPAAAACSQPAISANSTTGQQEQSLDFIMGSPILGWLAAERPGATGESAPRMTAGPTSFLPAHDARHPRGERCGRNVAYDLAGAAGAGAAGPAAARQRSEPGCRRGGRAAAGAPSISAIFALIRAMPSGVASFLASTFS